MSTEWIALATGGEARVHRPLRPPRGLVVVAGELFGITDYVETILARIAGHGFVAAAPDFTWRSERRLALGYDEAGRARGFELMGRLTDEDVVAEVEATRVALVTPGPVAMFGFSAGGHLALIAAVRLRFDLLGHVYAPWTVHGEGPLREARPPMDDVAKLVGTDVYAAVGEQDHVISPAEWREIVQRYRSAGVTAEVESFPGVPHGFMCPDRPDTYRPEQTEHVWGRLLAHLDGATSTGSPGSAPHRRAPAS